MCVQQHARCIYILFWYRSVKTSPTSTAKEDEDVARERERVHKGGAQNDMLRICDLTKVTNLHHI